MLGDEFQILEAVRARVQAQLPAVAFDVIRSAEHPWEWSLQVALPGGHPRHLYWRSNQWHATMRYGGEASDEIYILEPIAAADDEMDAIDRGEIIAVAAAGSVALDVIADRGAGETATGSEEMQAALTIFGAAVMALQIDEKRGASGAPETRALASTLRSEWLIGRLDDLQE